jgi:predicted acyl esterase
VKSDCRDTDFIAKLIDLHPDGRAMLLMDGVIRAMYRDPSGEPRHLAPDCVERLTINLGHICHTSCGQAYCTAAGNVTIARLINSAAATSTS